MDIMTLFSSSATRSRRATASVVAGMTLAGATVAFSAPAQAASVSTWDAIAACESGGDWSINTGNGFYGGVQFTLSSWQATGGQGYPHQASKAEQIKRADILQDMQGWGAWPVCSRKIGVYGTSDGSHAVAVERTSTVERQSTAAAEREAAAEKAAAQRAAAAERVAAKKAAVAEKVAADKAAAAEKVAAKKAAVAEKAAPVKTAPVKTAPAKATPAKAAAQKAAPAVKTETITVVAGDFLYRLAKEHKVEGGWEALYEANKDIIDDPALIYIGQELVLPQG